MKHFLLLGTLFCSFIIHSQNEPHFCALSHQGEKSPHSGKYLSVQAEAKANLYDVTWYNLDLAMTNQSSDISGTVTIQAVTLNALDSVIMELDQNFTISDLRLNGLSTPYNRYGTVLAIPINAISSGQIFELEIDYAGTAPPISSNPAGVSGVYNTFVSAMSDNITFTVSTPFYAHQWFPVKQILRDKADSSRVTLTVPSSCKAASNGVLMNTSDLGDGTTKYEWNNTHPIGYNLIFAAIAPFTEYNLQAFPSELGGAPVEIQNYLYGSGTTLTNMQAQCDLIPGFMELFSDIFGLYPYSDQRFGILAAPFGGGMEHQTMPTIGTFEKKITAHELGHMWWGDKVGFSSFSDIWLSEGMATYAEYIMLENLYPSEATPLLLAWHTNVKTGASGSVYHVDTFNLYRIYDSRLSYRKAASIIHTLRGIIDNDVLFFQALGNYYNEFQDSTASSADFVNSIENSTGLDLTDFFNQWLYGQGYPRYYTRWNSVNNDLLLEITHTASYPSATPTFTNPIEISFTRSSGADTTIRFDISANLDQFYISGIGDVTGVAAIDPNNWVVNSNGTNTYDPDFIAGIQELEGTVEPVLYPNPTNSSIAITNIDRMSYSLSVNDLGGREIEKFSSVPEIVDLSTLQPGIYLFQFVSVAGSGFYNLRVVKE